MTTETIKDDFSYDLQSIEILGSKIRYIEEGEGDPILFLHGIPTSSYVWRNVIPHLSSLGRCIAPDLIGFGQSDKPNIEFSVFDHIEYIRGFIEVLGLKRLTLVMHGWGSVLGFNYAMSHENNCKGLVFYEAYLRPFLGDDDRSLPYKIQLIDLKEQENRQNIIKNCAPMVEKMLTQAALRKFTSKEMEYYCKPFVVEDSGKPLFQHLQEVPRAKESKVNHLISEYSKKLTLSQLPKLMLYSVPGFLTPMASVVWAKENLPNLEIAEVGEELHYAQESNPQLIGETISAWLQSVDQQLGLE